MATEPTTAQTDDGQVIHEFNWTSVFARAQVLLMEIASLEAKKIYGVPRGGSIVAGLLTALSTPEEVLVIVNDPHEADVIVDDIVDSGETMSRMLDLCPDTPYLNLVIKEAGLMGKWVVFPWEKAEESQGPTENVRRLLQAIGENPDREGLKDTPDRVVRAMKEMTSGTKQDHRAILNTLFTEDSDEMIVVRNIRFTSMCEHHMMPFMGIAHVGYLPSGKVIGLSKIPRLVDCFAKRLQIQERLTKQIGQALDEAVQGQGTAVVLSATHCCMSCRGVQKQDADMVTSFTSGAFRDDPSARQEFFDLVNSS